jgi:hypothetical protein
MAQNGFTWGSAVILGSVADRKLTPLNIALTGLFKAGPWRLPFYTLCLLKPFLAGPATSRICLVTVLVMLGEAAIARLLNVRNGGKPVLANQPPNATDARTHRRRLPTNSRIAAPIWSGESS